MTAIRKYSDVPLVECFDYNTVSSPMLYKAINGWRKIRRFRIRTHRRHDKTLAARIRLPFGAFILVPAQGVRRYAAYPLSFCIPTTACAAKHAGRKREKIR